MSCITRSFRPLIVLLCLSWLPAFGQAGQLFTDTTTGYLEVPAHLDLLPTTGFTVECWVYLNGHPPGAFDGFNSAALVQLGDSNDTAYRLIITSGKGFTFHLETDQGWTSLAGNIPIPLLVWNHVAASWDGATMRLYLNGVQVVAKSWGGSIQQAILPLRMAGGGTYPHSGNYVLRGSLDEVRIWDHARTASAIVGDMTAQLDNAPGLRAAWHFSGDFLDETGGLTAVPQGVAPLITPATSPVEPLQLVAPERIGIGSALHFKLRGALPNAPYFLDNSIGQQNFGTPLIAPLAGTFPLESPLLNLTYGPNAPGVFVDYLGYTNAAGEATATFHVPSFSYLIGTDIHSAFLYLQSLQPMVLGDISRVVTTTMTAPEPTISSLLPGAGPVVGGTTIALFGSNFAPGSTVQFGGVAATNVVVHDSTWITCTTPPFSITGPVTVDVISPSQALGRMTDAYSYVPLLQATSLSPIHAAPSQIVTVLGSGFPSQTTVTVSGITVPAFNISATSLQFSMPSGTSCHAVVTLATPEGQTASLVLNPGPVITSLSATSGPAAGGATLFILGSGFAPQASVTLGGVAASIVAQGPGFIQIVTPPAAIGATAVVVSNPDGCSVGQLYSYF